MTNLHLINTYSNEAITVRHAERCNAVMEDAGLDPEKDSLWNLSKETRWELSETMRKEYCIQAALRNDDQKLLQKLLNV